MCVFEGWGGGGGVQGLRSKRLGIYLTKFTKTGLTHLWKLEGWSLSWSLMNRKSS